MSNDRRPPRLGDLFTIRTPEPISFTNEATGATASVHVVKLNQMDSEAVEIRASAARARRVALLEDPTSDEYIAHDANVQEMSERQMIQVLVDEEMRSAEIEITTRIMASKKWSDGDLLRSLQDAWYGDAETRGLMRDWSDPNEDLGFDENDDPIEPSERTVEARRVWDKLMEFNQDVQGALEERREELTEQMDDSDAEDEVRVAALRERVLALMKEMDANIMYLEENRRQRLYYCVRDPGDWRKRYFGTLAEVDELPPWMAERIMETYNDISLTSLEGKGLPGMPGSSTSSAPSVAAEASTPSGPESASA